MMKSKARVASKEAIQDEENIGHMRWSSRERVKHGKHMLCKHQMFESTSQIWYNLSLASFFPCLLARTYWFLHVVTFRKTRAPQLEVMISCYFLGSWCFHEPPTLGETHRLLQCAIHHSSRKPSPEMALSQATYPVHTCVILLGPRARAVGDASVVSANDNHRELQLREKITSCQCGLLFIPFVSWKPILQEQRAWLWDLQLQMPSGKQSWQWAFHHVLLGTSRVHLGMSTLKTQVWKSLNNPQVLVTLALDKPHWDSSCSTCRLKVTQNQALSVGGHETSWNMNMEAASRPVNKMLSSFDCTNM